MQFHDRADGGRQLAGRLAAYADRADVLVLGLPRGGVPVAFEVAAQLHASMDILVVRKLGVPFEPELAMGAIASGGARVLNEDVVRGLGISEDAIEAVARKEQRELDRRVRLYRGVRPPPAVGERVVVVVDDGIATGATMRAAVAAVREQRPARLVVAAPVAAAATTAALRREAGVDEVVCVAEPESFWSVGTWYEEFPQTTDDEIAQVLARAWQAQGVGPRPDGSEQRTQR